MTSEESILEALAQPNPEQASQILQESLRGVVRIGLMNGMTAEVGTLCGPKNRTNKAGRFRGAGCSQWGLFEVVVEAVVEAVAAGSLVPGTLPCDLRSGLPGVLKRAFAGLPPVHPK
jgi:hypothetical protein